MSSRNELFIGRLPNHIDSRDLEVIFERYGRLLRCHVKYGIEMAYAFVDYEDRRDAKDAIKYENGRDLMGQNIVVEWARPLFQPATYDVCFRCHHSGHWARDCPELNRDRDSYDHRSRSCSRKRRSPSLSRNRRHSRQPYSRSRSHDCKRNRSSRYTISHSLSPDRKKEENRNKSPSNDRPRSKSHDRTDCRSKEIERRKSSSLSTPQKTVARRNPVVPRVVVAVTSIIQVDHQPSIVVPVAKIAEVLKGIEAK